MNNELSNERLVQVFCRVLEQATLRMGHFREFRLAGGRLLLMGRNEQILDYIHVWDIEAVLREEMARERAGARQKRLEQPVGRGHRG